MARKFKNQQFFSKMFVFPLKKTFKFQMKRTRAPKEQNPSEIKKIRRKSETDNENVAGNRENLPKNPILTSSGAQLKIIAKLGEGVFGAVYKVVDHSNKKYAVKLFKEEHSEVGEQSWARETAIMKAVTAINSANLIRMEDSWRINESVPNGFLKIAISFELKGRSVFEVMDSTKGKMPAGSEISFEINAIRVMGKQLLEAMEKLESVKIVHLDLKPENICFSSSCTFKTTVTGNVCFIQPSIFHVCVVDFGNARTIRQDKPPKYALVQTQNYRAPEIFLGLPFSVKSDIWSFGCILSELYTGDLLFYGNSKSDTEELQFELMQMIVQQPPSCAMLREAEKIKSTKIRIENGNVYMKRKSKSSFEPPKPLHKQRRPKDLEAIPLFDLLECILIVDPSRRPSLRDISSRTFFK